MPRRGPRRVVYCHRAVPRHGHDLLAAPGRGGTGTGGGVVMDFYALLDDVLKLLHQRGRVTYRALKRQFHLDDEVLDDLKEEILYGQRLAVEEDSCVLVWTGGTGITPQPISSSPSSGEAP